MEPSEPVAQVDWETQFDHYDPAYAADPFSVWEQLRETCPVARSERFRNMAVPTRHADIEAIARDTATFSSRSPVAATFASMADFNFVVPPISSDPPYHTSFRHLLLPFFAPRRIDELQAGVIEHADALIDAFLETGRCDGAEDYAQHIPVRVIARMLGVPDGDGDQFRTWIHDLLERGALDFDSALAGLMGPHEYFTEQIQRRQAQPVDERGDDLISFLLGAQLDGRPLDEHELFGGCLLLLVAGIDTTWSAIGASIWHLASHPEDQQRLRDEPDLWPTAIEELLRAYAPVTMARDAIRDGEIAGCPIAKGDPVLLPFPAANRDPAVFDRADEVLLDRERNRHVAFGIGIHRCLGSNLARMELRTALERFLAKVPPFRLADPDAVTWSAGQVHGPRTLPLEF
ncbi:MAG: Cytochrome [Acidimicrobiales bacterium]|nr:Cytochrome [Acidimicrobiales bacterium]